MDIKVDWYEEFENKKSTLEEAIACIPKGKHIFIGSGAAEPGCLVQEMVRQSTRFSDNQIVHLLTLGAAPYVEERYANNFRHNAFFIGSNVRSAVRQGRADYTPVFLYQIPELIRRRRLPVDVALIQVTPPDEFGFVNLGVSVDVVLEAVRSATIVIAQVNPRMPFVYGAGFVSVKDITAWVEESEPLVSIPRQPLDPVAQEIGHNVASLVEDGATVQLGIGQIPDAVAAALNGKSDLGIWTEMLPDGGVDLIKNGNVTGRNMTTFPRKVAASFTFGDEETYRYVNRNPTFTFQPSDFVNDPRNVAQQHKMVAINSALQIDLTGQVCSDSIGTEFYSGIGGQVDFIRGASMCPDGKAIIAIRSTARQGKVSKLAPVLDEGAGVVTSRGDVEYVVTEYGVADLRGKSIRERSLALISIAHPDFRSDLLASGKKRHYVFANQIMPRVVFPEHYEKVAKTKQGQEVLLRPIRETDEGKMSDLFYSFSPKTVQRRWLEGMSRMHHDQLQSYLEVDDIDNVAIVVETLPKNSEESELLGVGRYHVSGATGFAEVAFVVRDDWQGQGLGGTLLDHIIEIAKRNAVAGITADVLVSNDAMLRVFHSRGLEIQTKREGDTYSLRMPF